MTFRKSFFLLLIAVSFVVTGCSTVRPASSGRAGLFDRMSGKASPKKKVWVEDLGDPDLQESHLKAAYDDNEKARAKDFPNLKGLSLRWPVSHVEVTSGYGDRGREFHEGIDLRAPSGTPVLAAESGKVLYADGRIRGYGRMIVLKHRNGIATIYAHNSRLLVRAGQAVKRGQKIAISGATGKATGPHVHFEIRNGVAAVDPLDILPKVKDQSPVLVAERPKSKKKLRPRRALASRPARKTVQ